FKSLTILKAEKEVNKNAIERIVSKFDEMKHVYEFMHPMKRYVSDLKLTIANLAKVVRKQQEEANIKSIEHKNKYDNLIKELDKYKNFSSAPNVRME
ncbi:MAG: hypothetical protein GY874_22830, partial [Desulfobacteraceae bacterium]|nr:hypothetical protein [Desulfobacteraceae bacterium]